MKIDARWLILFLSGFLVSCNSAAMPPQPESNFGFVFEFGPCNIDKLDTYAGEFTQDRVVEPPITIPLDLTDGQMTIIYEKMVEIKIDTYPEEFTISKPLFGEYILLSTSFFYSIQIENGDRKISTRWVDNVVQPASEKADRLRDFFHMIVEMIKSAPSYMQLPETEFGCI